MTTATSPSGLSFLRRRSTRLVAGAAGVAGFALVGASPALAAEPSDCTVGNTVDSTAGGTAADIQTLLDANAPVICLTGEFLVTSTLVVFSDVELLGLPAAVLDGDNSVGILTVDSDERVSVENLTLQNGSAQFGGAISAYEVESINSTFLHNEAEFGGAISAYSATISGSTFITNAAEYIGGAILADLVSVETSLFGGNQAGDAGGAIFGYTSVEAEASTFAGNFAQYVGGAIITDSAEVVNSTFVENEVGEDVGGAIFVYEAGTVAFSTFLDNTAGAGADAIFADTEGSDEVLLRGNILAGAASAHGQLEGGAFSDGGGNQFSTTAVEEPDFTATQASTLFGISAAAQFAGAGLDDNGGPTPTIALNASSPAVNGVPAGSPSVSVDQRGVARDAVSDSGAYEFQGPPAPVLAATGSTSAGWLAASAGALLALGAAAFGFTRRRRA